MATQDAKIKWVEGSPFMVDGFRFQNPACKHYLLTHFHSDHTTGLYKSFSAGHIYTSKGTANLIVELMGVNRERVVALEMDKPHMVAGFELTLIDANHCPAAVMFVIRDPRPGGRTSLHTGDFRADKSVCTSPVVKSLKGKVDSLYLDTTYCGPRHTFPDQEEVLAQAAHLVRVELQRDPNTLFLVGTYSIGKERVLEAVAKAAGSRCLVTSRKARTMRLSGAWDDSTYTTHDGTTGGGVADGPSGAYARVRAVPLQDTNSPATLLGVLAAAREAGASFTSVVGVRPTGWTHTNARKGKGGGAGDKAGGIQSSIATTRAAAGGGAGDKGDAAGNPSDCNSSTHGESLGESEPPPDGDDQDDEAAAWGGGDGFEEDGGGAGDGGSGSTEPPPPSWAGKKPWVDGNARVYSLPYSEHSSFPQLKNFVRAVRPRKIVPTVNSASPASVEKMLGHFLEFMDLSSDRKRLDSYFSKRGSPDAGGDPFAPPPAPRAEKRRKEVKGAKGGAAATTGLLQLLSKARPCAADVAAGTTSGVSAASTAAKSASPIINLSGDAAVELNLGDVDVEAQKAIMADIERRRRGQRQDQDRDQDQDQDQEQEQAADRRVVVGVGGAASGAEETPRQAKAADTKEKIKKQALRPPAATGSGARRGAVVGIGRGGEAAERSVGLGAEARARAAAVATPRPEKGFDRQRVLSVDDGSAESTSPMDIRDFFSRHG